MGNDHDGDQKIRQDLLKLVAAQFLSFALGLNAETLKSALVAPNFNDPNVLLTLIFLFSWLSFFLGIHFFVSQPPVSVGVRQIDLTATLITLALLVFLGATATTQTKTTFIWLLFGLYAFETVWDYGRKIYLSRSQPRLLSSFPRFWYWCDPLLAALTGLFLIFSWLPLWGLGVIHFAYAVLTLCKLL